MRCAGTTGCSEKPVLRPKQDVQGSKRKHRMPDSRTGTRLIPRLRHCPRGRRDGSRRPRQGALRCRESELGAAPGRPGARVRPAARHVHSICCMYSLGLLVRAESCAQGSIMRSVLSGRSRKNATCHPGEIRVKRGKEYPKILSCCRGP